MSDTPSRTETDIIPVDQAIGDDADQPGIAQPVTQDEIEDILNNPTLPMEERQMRLNELRSRIGERENVDLGGDMSAIELQINEALSMLADGGHTYGTLDGMGMDPDGRADARSPDDDLSLGAPDAIGSREPQ